MQLADLPAYVFAVPLLGAVLLLAVGRWLPRLGKDLVALGAALASLVLSARLVAATLDGDVVSWVGGWKPNGAGVSVGVVLVVDRVGAGLSLLVGLLMTAALIFSWRYFEDVEAHFHVLMLTFLAGMAGFALSGDLFDMFVFFELMGAAAYALTGFRVEEPQTLQGGLNFAVVNSLGAYTTLLGIGLVYARTGELGLAQISRQLDGPPDGLVVAGFVLVLAGFLVKSAAVPFHFWLADAHAVAPSPVCVLFSGVMVELGLYAVARVSVVAFGGALPQADVRRALLVLAVVTAAVGAAMCVAQRHVKRLLAFSTIGHVGLFLASLALLDPEGSAGAVLYVAGHAGVKGALFLMAGVLLNRYGTVDEGALHGRGRELRWSRWLFVLGALMLAGLPGTGAGLGKAVGEEALVHAGYGWAPVLFVLVSGITGGAVLRAGLRIYWGLGPPPELTSEESRAEEEPETRYPLGRIPWTMLVAVSLLLGSAVASGVVPAVARWAGAAGAELVDRAGYVGQALLLEPAQPHLAAETAWTASGLLLDGLSVLVAVTVATLGTGALRRWHPGSVVSAGRGATAGLRKLHSGHIGDYVAWLLLGVVALAALVGVPLAR